MELAEALLHTLNVVGEETGKEKEGTGRLPAKSPVTSLVSVPLHAKGDKNTSPEAARGDRR